MSRNDVRKVIKKRAGHVGLVPLVCLWLDSVKWGAFRKFLSRGMTCFSVTFQQDLWLLC